MQKGYIELQKPPVIVSAASVVGKHEYEGPLGEFFDLHDPDGNFGQKTWEQAEAEMQRQAINIALSKAKTDAKNIDALFAGDLINQCICSAQGTRHTIYHFSDCTEHALQLPRDLYYHLF